MPVPSTTGGKPLCFRKKLYDTSCIQASILYANGALLGCKYRYSDVGEKCVNRQRKERWVEPPLHHFRIVNSRNSDVLGGSAAIEGHR